MLYHTNAIQLDPSVTGLSGSIVETAPGAYTVSFDGYPASAISISGYVDQRWAAMTLELWGLASIAENASTDWVCTVDELDTSIAQNLAITWNENSQNSGATAHMSNNGTATATVTIHAPLVSS